MDGKSGKGSVVRDDGSPDDRFDKPIALGEARHDGTSIRKESR